MRILLFYILLALQIGSPSQQVTKSPSKDDSNNSVTQYLSDSVTYYESQIRLADSLYKNYLPQYNFDEVKKAVAFFERISGTPELRKSGNSFPRLDLHASRKVVPKRELFDLAITKYKKALEYVEILEDEQAEANVLKELGNSYQLANKPDSALYYYNESLRYNSSLPNILDVEKSITKILFR